MNYEGQFKPIKKTIMRRRSSLIRVLSLNSYQLLTATRLGLKSFKVTGVFSSQYKGAVTNVVVLANFLSVSGVDTPLPPLHIKVALARRQTLLSALPVWLSSYSRERLNTERRRLRHRQSTVKSCRLPVKAKVGPSLWGVLSPGRIKRERDIRLFRFTAEQSDWKTHNTDPHCIGDACPNIALSNTVFKTHSFW